MAGNSFDPDAYLAQKGGATSTPAKDASQSFDPDAYLTAKAGPSIAERASGAVRSLGNATAETMLPPTSVDAAKRLLSPQAGQYGLSNLAQREGEKVQKAVSAVSPTAGEFLPPLTPKSEQQQLGAEAVLGSAGAAVRPAGEAALDVAEQASGLTKKAPGRLAEIFDKPSDIAAQGRKAAGEQFEEAKAGLGGPGRLADVPKKTELIDTVGDMLKKGESPTGGEALRARQAIDNELYNKNTTPYNEEWLNDTRAKLDAIVKADPAMKDADAAYQAGARASAARSAFPLKGAKGSLPGRLMFGLATGGVSEAARSPLVQSLAAAAAGSARNLAPAAIAATENQPGEAPQAPPTDFADKLRQAIAHARQKNGK